MKRLGCLAGYYLSRKIHDLILPPIPVYREAVLRSVIPAFEGIDAEVEAFAQSEYERLCAQSVADDDESATLAEIAQDNSIAFGQTLYGVRQGILNLCAAGLFHLLEQQLAEIWNDAGVWIPRPQAKLEDVVVWMAQHTGIDLRAGPYWTGLDTLRLVANATKHAEGSSARHLRERRPDLFEDPFSVELFPGLGGKRRLTQPLAGEGLYVTEKEFGSMADTAAECLTDLAEQFRREGNHEYPDR
jgi:hypothetical protein